MSHTSQTFALSAGWRSLKREIDKDIEGMRDRLEKSADPVLCAELRGEIRRARKIISAVQGVKPPVMPQIEDDGPIYT